MNSSGISDANDLHSPTRPLSVVADRATQLERRRLTLAERPPLRDNVATEEITPTTVMLNYDAGLGRIDVTLDSWMRSNAGVTYRDVMHRLQHARAYGRKAGLIRAMRCRFQRSMSG